MTFRSQDMTIYISPQKSFFSSEILPGNNKQNFKNSVHVGNSQLVFLAVLLSKQSKASEL